MPIYTPPIQIGASNTTYDNGTVLISGGNNITVSTNGNTISIVAAAGGGVAANLVVQGANSTVTATSGTINWYGGNAQTLSLATAANATSVSIIGAPAGPSVGVVGSTQTNGTVIFSNGGNVSFGMNGSTVTAFYDGLDNRVSGNTTGSTKLVSGNQSLVYAGGNNITLSCATDAIGQTVSIVGGAGGGGGGATVRGWNIPYGAGPGDMANVSLHSDGTMSVIPFRIPANMTANQMRMVISRSISSAASTNAVWNLSLSMGIYTLNGSTLSLASTATRSYNMSSSGASASSFYTGMRAIDIDTVGGGVQGNSWNLTPGDYWLGVNLRVNATLNNAISLMGIQHGMNTATSNAAGAFLGEMGLNSANATSKNIGVFGPGVLSASTAAMPTSIASNALRYHWRIPYIYMGNFDPSL